MAGGGYGAGMTDSRESIRFGQPPALAPVPPPPAPGPPRGRPAWHLAVAAAAGAAVVLLAVAGVFVALRGNPFAGKPASAAASPSTAGVFKVYGDMTLSLGDFGWGKSPEACWGKGGYDDIRAGAQVVITDANGVTVGVGRLIDGDPTVYDDRASSCVFRWEIPNVPDGSSFYAVEISHRGKVQFNRADITRSISLTLG